MVELLATGYAGAIYTVSFDGKALTLAKTDTTLEGKAGISWLDVRGPSELLILDEFGDAAAPVHTAFKDTKLFVANYMGCSVDVYDLQAAPSAAAQGCGVVVYDPAQAPGVLQTYAKVATRALKREDPPSPPRQEQSHPHSVYVDPSGRYLLCVDLGTDAIHVFDIADDLRALPDISVKTGSGPRHLAFKGESLCYLINELDSTVHVYDVSYEAGFQLTLKQRVYLLSETASPAGWTAAEIAVVGDVLVLSSRADEEILPGAEGDLLQTYAIDATSGTLALRSTYRSPLRGLRHFLPVQIDARWYIIAGFQYSGAMEAIDLESGEVVDTLFGTKGLTVVKSAYGGRAGL